MDLVHSPILIIGAGVSGLTLAQALRKEGIPFQIVERDGSLSSRSAGWGLTIHWALPAFLNLLPQELQERLPETYVNPEAVKNGEIGSFAFYDLGSGEVRWKVPPNERIRVSRERLRKLLITGIDVKWSKRLTTLSVVEDSLDAHFDDGTSCTADLIIGCDGIHSGVRSACFPFSHGNYELPVRMLGISVPYTADQIRTIRKLDPFFLHGSDPKTDAYLWFSFLDIPPHDTSGTSPYVCQIMISWPYRSGFLDDPLPLEIPRENSERLALAKRLSTSWAEPFRSIVHGIPEGTEVRPVSLQDWVPQREANSTGKIALIGDAAHSMVMFRGEGANHAITDISNLLSKVLPLLRVFKDPSHHSTHNQRKPLKQALKEYEEEMYTRSKPAVLASRQACLDAHRHERINEISPLIARRIMVDPRTVENTLD